jgi:hypothetical protein
VDIESISNRPAKAVEEAMRRHPSAAAIWTPDDFTEAADQAMAIIREDTATVYDFTTGEVIA